MICQPVETCVPIVFKQKKYAPSVCLGWSVEHIVQKFIREITIQISFLAKWDTFIKNRKYCSNSRHSGGNKFTELDRTSPCNKSWNRELTLKCKLKCYLNPWITHWTLALVKGNREPHEAKKKSFDFGGNRTHDHYLSTICVPSATRHNFYMYPYFLFAAIHHPKSSPTFSVRPCSSVGRVMGLSSTIIYTSELILCSTICVPSAMRHNIHMYPYFFFAAIHHPKSSPTFFVRPCSSVGRVTVDLIRRSWVRFPPRSKDFFVTSCVSLFPFTRAIAQWVIYGFK